MGQSNEIFDLQFFSSIEPHWIKIFSFLVSFSPIYLYFSIESPCSMILCGESEKFEYLGENETKSENILNHWSVVGSNDEKSWG